VKEEIEVLRNYEAVFPLNAYFEEKSAMEGGEEAQKEQLVAIKKMKMNRLNVRLFNSQESEGINFTALREIRLLQTFTHPNIVVLKDVFFKGKAIFLTLEYCQQNLYKLIADRDFEFSPS